VLAAEVRSVAITADGSYAATASDIAAYRVWDLRTGSCHQRQGGHTNSISALAMTADGRRILSGSYDTTVRVWDSEGTMPGRSYASHDDTVQCVRDLGGRRVATGSDDKSVMVRDLAEGRCERTLDGHFEGVRALAFDGDRGHLLSAGTEPSIRVWDVS